MEHPLNPASDDTVDSRPLLRNTSPNRDNDRGRRPSWQPSLRCAAWFLRKASSRQIMTEPSMLVRETATKQLEEWHNDWAYSRPMVVLDLLWNLAFVAAALVLSRDEDPPMPLRLWIMGYARFAVLAAYGMCVEYRHHQVQGELMEDGSGRRSSSQQDVEEDGVYDAEQTKDE